MPRSRWTIVVVLVLAASAHPTQARAQSDPDPGSADPAVVTALAVGSLTPVALGVTSVALTEGLDPGDPAVVGAVVPLVAGSMLTSTLAWWAIGEERAAWTNLALDASFLALGTGVSWLAASSLGLEEGEALVRGLSWTSLVIFGFASLVASTQVAPGRLDPELHLDARGRDGALATGVGALGALAGGAAAMVLTVPEGPPRWGEIAVGLGLAAIAPAIGWAMVDEWRRAGEALLVGVCSVAIASLIALVAAPFIQVELPGRAFDEVFARGFAMGTALVGPVGAFLYGALGS